MRTAVLSYLGIRGHDLIQQLKAGKTLAEIADATPGRSAAGLSEVIVKALTAKVNAAATANHLDKKAQAAHLARLRERVSHLLARTHFGGHRNGAPAPAPSPSG